MTFKDEFIPSIPNVFTNNQAEFSSFKGSVIHQIIPKESKIMRTGGLFSKRVISPTPNITRSWIFPKSMKSSYWFTTKRA